MKFFISCAKGLEYLLVDEAKAMGVPQATATMAGVNADGSLADAQRLVMFSRLASRVLWPIAHFDCRDEQDLYQNMHDIDWAAHIGPGATLAIDARISSPTLTHERYAAQRAKDAIVDRLRAQTGGRPDIDVENADVRINLHVRKDKADIAIDLGGGSLHKRGWRQEQGEAPIKENLAAALLYRGKWPEVYKQGGAILDPMCGSGTLLIEAALMAADEAPGLHRHKESLPTRWMGFDAAGWQALVNEARQRAEQGRAGLAPVFIGYDSHADVLHKAVANCDRAGFAELIQFERQPVSNLAAPRQESGLVVCNMPYNQRLQADPALYKETGLALKRAVPNWRAVLLCGNDDLAYATGLRAQKKYAFFNGSVECTMLVCNPIDVPRKESTEPKALSEGALMVANRLQKNLRKFDKWAKQNGVSCYRVYDADLPEYAAAIDVYPEADGECRLFLHVQEYEAPPEIPEEDTSRRFRELLSAVEQVFALPRAQVSVKKRKRGKGGSKYGRMDETHDFIQVQEGQAKLWVNLFDYIDTGLFLDHRPMRLRLAKEAAGKRFLNLFCYTGTASVQAVISGAVASTSVDLSATYLDWAEANFELNDIQGGSHQLVKADVTEWLGNCRQKFDLVFCDPPTFSNSASAEDFDVQKDHVALLEKIMSVLSDDGVCYFSNNFRKFKLDVEALSAFADVEDISA
ncbi:MAG TPA: bifunctional 23S rRNA (guanine(2069)-N(7))-methyltransferase RlmK/23S rRNA (guanine(2445)-N(2))-methyltransferase RlmL, partial [Arenimonas sp.]|nr:bifunctional 23S rRNA (guanine(2069)-N(7))-methyltransferase RlmK/23S rRNA (guanine(2445)-N(2))-methyltransferase RlmL [Arenimonas sp.]